MTVRSPAPHEHRQWDQWGSSSSSSSWRWPQADLLCNNDHHLKAKPTYSGNMSVHLSQRVKEDLVDVAEKAASQRTGQPQDAPAAVLSAGTVARAQGKGRFSRTLQQPQGASAAVPSAWAIEPASTPGSDPLGKSHETIFDCTWGPGICQATYPWSVDGRVHHACFQQDTML